MCGRMGLRITDASRQVFVLFSFLFFTTPTEMSWRTPPPLTLISFSSAILPSSALLSGLIDSLLCSFTSLQVAKETGDPSAVNPHMAPWFYKDSSRWQKGEKKLSFKCNDGKGRGKKRKKKNGKKIAPAQNSLSSSNLMNLEWCKWLSSRAS